MRTEPLLTTTDAGFYCPVGNFHIDPWKPVARAVITHAHADHYAWGCDHYLVAAEGVHVFRTRLGADAQIQTLPYGETLEHNGVRISLHPAGHILGSAQIRVEHEGEVWVITGDYKTEQDSTCAPFELVRCHGFITEATFGLPIYAWRPQQQIFAEINGWWRQNAEEGRASVLYCYALGKAQRVLAGVDASIGPIFTHGATERLNRAYRASGVALPETTYAMEATKSDFRGALICAPTSVRGTSWLNRFGSFSSGYVSGWMRIRGARRQRAVDRGFVLSDHVDWRALMATIKATGAERVGVTHGYIPVVVRYLREQGIDAYGIETRFSSEVDDSAEAEENEPEAQS
ncbi:MAG: ligase-associated DNA damage response exonuclease [Caldilineaceae bacterium]|nr:ligase-associated DNA damage response exonuclease [Caldilineaceae bacterium]